MKCPNCGHKVQDRWRPWDAIGNLVIFCLWAAVFLTVVMAIISGLEPLP